MSGKIDTILIRKLGGWKLVPVKTWIGWSHDKRQKLLDRRNVQFFMGDMPIPDEDAQVMLGLAAPQEVPVVAESEEKTAAPVLQELIVQESVNVLYARVQQETKQMGGGPVHGPATRGRTQRCTK